MKISKTRGNLKFAFEEWKMKMMVAVAISRVNVYIQVNGVGTQNIFNKLLLSKATLGSLTLG